MTLAVHRNSVINLCCLVQNEASIFVKIVNEKLFAGLEFSKTFTSIMNVIPSNVKKMTVSHKVRLLLFCKNKVITLSL